ncbi:hypothetical protein P4S52_18280 [Vibrio sp. SA48]|uniref:Uncharacterized protein n=1 Tax=Vibrio aestuarianus TaxID=28171 RepID=A0A7X6N7F8_9VIBR|nr:MULTISPECIES: hypothetical protein [Vibrio]MBD1566433.1 hypothetical protein [Vibrio sp. S12_S33]MDE1211792.1 hypothetical protein [Vibrio aestuarianus]MDE1215139.1 hypothetical protein [Vibrio aestuarianus]MDE1218844.1 hypothetical protein [Vibrio aestuarianus]MDE1221948.1 hypothetical protein [Vibrio aestuarianus]
MTINKFYVLVPQAVEEDAHRENEVQSEMEAQRQALLQQARQLGGL